jgi:hypothetical protein
MKQRKKSRTSFTLSDEALQILQDLAKTLGLNKTATLEWLLREESRRRRRMQ